jgi:peptidoglycan/xylan/chitin deacetylase (PgdA/CDA1 family)
VPTPPEPLTAVRVVRSLAPRMAWAEGMEFRLPPSALRACELADGRLTVPADLPPLPPGEAERLRRRAAFTAAPPMSGRLPVSYQLVPPFLRCLYAGAAGRWQRLRQAKWAAFPGWPLDLSADFLADLAGGPPSPFAGGPTPVLLSHDLDSPEGLRNVVRHFLDLEEAVGARSSCYLVPCAWPVDHGLLGEVHARGHEVGVHGHDHGNRTAFCPPAERQRRLRAARPLIERYGVEGYRAPSLLRTPGLLRDLAAHYRYDSSVPTAGGPFPVPNNGCASARPFHLEGIAELPLSLPRDGSLRFLGHTPAEILAIWKQCAEAIARSGGVVVVLTHCEARFSGNPAMLAVYRDFLEYLASSSRFAWSTPRAVLGRAPGLRAA